jgi:hypothetical protein
METGGNPVLFPNLYFCCKHLENASIKNGLGTWTYGRRQIQTESGKIKLESDALIFPSIYIYKVTQTIYTYGDRSNIHLHVMCVNIHY